MFILYSPAYRSCLLVCPWCYGLVSKLCCFVTVSSGMLTETWNKRTVKVCLCFSQVKYERHLSVFICPFCIPICATPGWEHHKLQSQLLGYGLDDQGSGVRFPAGAGNFSLNHCVQTSSGAHPASYPMGIRDYFPGGKVAGAWSWPLTSV
jgi:hypothetical protein